MLFSPPSTLTLFFVHGERAISSCQWNFLEELNHDGDEIDRWKQRTHKDRIPSTGSVMAHVRENDIC